MASQLHHYLVVLLITNLSAHQALAAPVNDAFADAQLVLDNGTWSGSNVDATSQPGEPVHAGVGGGRSVWWKWTAPTTGFITVDTIGSGFDTVLALYTGPAVDQLDWIASNDDAVGRQSRVADVPVTGGTLYHIAVDGWSGSSGAVTLNTSFFDGTDTTPPTILHTAPADGDVFVLNAQVPANYACEDGPLGSGVDSCAGDIEFDALIDTATAGPHSFSVTATDVAGNSQTSTINYTISGTDTTPPAVAIQVPSNDSVFAAGTPVSVDYACADEFQGTGIASCVGDLPIGSALDTSTPGAYQFAVTGIDVAGNETSISASYAIVEAPTNDAFDSAVFLAPETGAWSGTNVGATVEPGEPDHVYLPTEASIWFRYIPIADGFLTVDTFGSNFDTALAMYTGVSVDALTRVASNLDAHGTNQSEIALVPVTAGVAYHIAVDGFFGDVGLVSLNWTQIEQFDFEPPVITFWSPTDGALIPQDDARWAGYSCYDPQPSTGLVSCEGPIPSGTRLDTSVPGVFMFTVTAIDGAGNQIEETHNYTIAANPANDDFADATVLEETGSVSGTNLGATGEPSEPFHAGSSGSTSVWFRWTAPTDGFLSADTLGSDFDTLLAVYSGNAVNALTEVDANDDAVGAQSAVYDAPVSAGVTYSIVVAGDWGSTGLYTLNWTFAALNDVTSPTISIASPSEGGMYFEGTSVLASFDCIDEPLGSGVESCIGDLEDLAPLDTALPGPAAFSVTATDNAGNSTVETSHYTIIALTNDPFDSALPLSGSGQIVVTNPGATKEPGEPAHAGEPGGASLWFRWTASEDGFLSVDTLLTDVDTLLAVYTGESVDALNELASDNDSLGVGSQVSDIPVVAGESYHIAVDTVDGAIGQFIFNYVFFSGPTFTEISPTNDPLWVTDADHDFVLNAAAPADIDGDGDLDLAVIGYYVEYNVGATERLVVFINEGPGANGEWAFSTQEVPLNGLFSNESDLAWGDFDGDGDPDLAVAAEGATQLYRNETGVLTPIEAELPPYAESSNYSNAYDLRSLTWADIDNDSDLDLLIPSVREAGASAYETALMINDGADQNGGWTFTRAGVLLDGAVHAQTAWADHDGDGDLDLFMANVDNFYDNGYVRIYDNNGGQFDSAEPIGNLKIEYGMADWADYDSDGDLDILVVGLIQDVDGLYKTLLRIYTNNAGVYQPDTVVQSSFFPWLDLSAATWADYDSDGDVDILLTGSVIGEDNTEGKSEVYVNEGGSFVPLGRDLPAPNNAGGDGGAFTWFDVDGDGDLDYFVAGAYWVPNGSGLIERQMHLYRNDSITTNDRPQPPGNPTAQVDEATGVVTLGWSAAMDDTTASDALTYDLEIRALGSGGAPGDNYRRLPQPGDVSAVTGWTVGNLPPGTYEWQVRAVDSAFNGSLPVQGSFVIGGVMDTDSDGISDLEDNCVNLSNPAQRDTDGDGFGNRCDADLNNDGVVNVQDLGLLRTVFFTNDPDADFDGDGVVNVVDLGILRSLFFLPPG